MDRITGQGYRLRAKFNAEVVAVNDALGDLLIAFEAFQAHISVKIGGFDPVLRRRGELTSAYEM